MRFRNVRAETEKTLEGVCVIIAISAIFFQIWILSTSLEALFQGKNEHLIGAVFFSGICLAFCGLTAWLTTFHHLKGHHEGRSTTYHKETHF